jgi:outer membrane protein insertion porin family
MDFVRRTVLVLSLLLAALPAMAQDSGRVRQIVVQGTQRIEVETVKSYMTISEGDPYDVDRVDRSLKALFATGLFADVSIRREGDQLVVRVVENPIINRLAFEGNHRLKDEELNSEVQLRPRTVYTRPKVVSDVKRILELYRRNGRFAATVEPKIIQLDQNRVDLVFEIAEGPATYVKRINFVGNHAYSEDKLRDVLMTKEERWYRFLSSDDTYDPDRLTYDRELLRRFFLKHGYADFRVVSAVAELTPDREGFFITFTIDEGERFKFGDSKVTANLRDLKADDLKALITTEKGEWYNADQVEDVVQKMTDAVGSKGYAFVDVRPQMNRDREKKVVDVTYEVAEGPRVFVERIDITGNVRTLDKVIRREFKLAEGDAFNSAKLRRSRQRIKDLNFFEKVEVNNVPSETAPDRTIIKVEVQEKSTGELQFGVGWSSSAGPLIEASLRERNLLGRGQDLRLSGSIGTKRNQIDLSFTEPYFLGRQLAAGFDLFATQQKMQTESGYTADSQGGALRMGYVLSDNLRQDWRYQIKRDTVKNVDSTSLYVLLSQGSATTSSVSQTLTYDRRDSRLDPTEGYMLRMNNEVAGAGGTEKWFRNNLTAQQFYTVGEQMVLALNGNVGFMHDLGAPVRITERYYLGGDKLRGFANAGVSPRDAQTGDAIGGLWEYNGSVQLSFPLGLPDEFGFNGHAFSDFGSIGGVEKQGLNSDVNSSTKLRASVGAGVGWKSPMGPVTVDLGFPISKESFDKRELFRFNFGTRF